MSGTLSDHLAEGIRSHASKTLLILQHIDSVGPKLPDTISNRLTTSFNVISNQLEQIKVRNSETLTTYDDVIEGLNGALEAYMTELCEPPSPDSQLSELLTAKPVSGFGSLLEKFKSKRGNKMKILLADVERRTDALETLGNVELNGNPIPVSVQVWGKRGGK